jgi:hypothetical protein
MAAARWGYGRGYARDRPHQWRTGLVVRVGGHLQSVISIDTDGVRILALYIVLNPEKLAGIENPAG